MTGRIRSILSDLKKSIQKMIGVRRLSRECGLAYSKLSRKNSTGQGPWKLFENYQSCNIIKKIKIFKGTIDDLNLWGSSNEEL